jgi:catechol 2,3-dioxygenase-like lactoylglutathione lyase family enzyme
MPTTPRPAPHDGLRHLAVRTRDLGRTERFYREVLGFELAFPHQGMIFLRVPGGDDLLNFVETREAFDPRAGGLDHFGMHVPEARWDEMLARLEAAGVKIESRRGRSAIYIEDPNGYTIELYRD